MKNYRRKSTTKSLGKTGRSAMTPTETTSCSKATTRKPVPSGDEDPLERDLARDIVSLTDPLFSEKRPYTQGANDSESIEPMQYVPPSASSSSPPPSGCGSDPTTAAATTTTTRSRRHDYFGRLLVNSGGYAHTISLGDMIAFRSTEDKYGVKEKLSKKDSVSVTWTVGHVVTLFACKLSPKDTRYYATVQWLPRWKKQYEKRVTSKKLLRLIEEDFRPDQALIESQTLLTIHIQQQVLPVQVCLQSWRDVQGIDAIPSTVLGWSSDDKMHGPVHQVYFNCVLMDARCRPGCDDVRSGYTKGDLPNVGDDWAVYVETPPTDNNNTLPKVLERAWALLRHPLLEAALKTYYEKFMVVEEYHPFQGYQSQWKKRIVAPPQQKKRPPLSSIANDNYDNNHKTTKKIKTNDSSFSKDSHDAKASTMRRKSAKEAKVTLKKRCRPAKKDGRAVVDGTTPIESAADKTTLITFDLPPPNSDNCEEKKLQSMDIDKTRQSANDEDPCERNKRRKTDPSTNQEHQLQLLSKKHPPGSTSLPKFQPTLPAVYSTRSRAKTDPEYFTSATCSPAPYHHYRVDCWKTARSTHNETSKTSNWTIDIGDVIALRLEDHMIIAKSSLVSRDYFPFRTLWGIAQVLSIYSLSNNEGSGDDRLEMEVRWFSRYDELDEVVQENTPPHVRDGSCFVEMDEHVSTVPVDLALAPVRVTSTIIRKNTNLRPETLCYGDGSPCSMPFWTISCRDLCLTEVDDDHLYPLDHQDWPRIELNEDNSNHNHVGSIVLSDGPIRRGLYCPKAKSRSNKRLFKAYEPFLRKRVAQYGLADNHVHDGQPNTHKGQKLREWKPDENKAATVHREWSSVELDPMTRVVRCLPDDRLYSDKNSRICFYTSIQISALKQRCDHRAFSKKIDASNGSSIASTTACFQVKIGQVVCFADNESKVPVKSYQKNSNLYFPFSGPWSVYQILTLYEFEGNDKKKIFHFEGRRLFRACELPEQWHEFLPVDNSATGKDSAIQVLYESDDVQDNLPASRILGLVDLSLGRTVVSTQRAASANSVTPLSWLTVHHQCRYFYHKELSKLQPLFVADPSPKKWKCRFVARGLALSRYLRNRPALSSNVEFEIGIPIPKRSWTESEEQKTSPQPLELEKLGNLFRDLLHDGISQRADSQKAFTRQGRSFFYSVQIEPPWSKYQVLVCHMADRKGQFWRIRVGDIVAVAADTAASRTSGSSFPFTISWAVCQVLSIYDGGINDTTGNNSSYSVEIRFLKTRGKGNSDDTIIPAVFETDKQEEGSIRNVAINQLLGPIMVATQLEVPHVWDHMVPFLPACPFIFGGFHDEKWTGSVDFVDHAHMVCSLVERGVHFSKKYTNPEQEELVPKLKSMIYEEFGDGKRDKCIGKLRDSRSGATSSASVSQSSMCSSTTTTIAGVSGLPFHIEKSSGTEYSEFILVRPPYDSYCKPFKEPPYENVIWKVSLGDSVVVRYKYFAGQSICGQFNTEKKRTHPFDVPWAVCEIVNIFKPGPNSESASPNGQHGYGIKIEIRWLYRLDELSRHGLPPGIAGRQRCEEVVESDHYDIISASAILAPAELNEKPVDATKQVKTYLGMPVKEFVCRRFWSVHRKGCSMRHAFWKDCTGTIQIGNC